VLIDDQITPPLPPAGIQNRIIAWCVDRIVLLPFTIGVMNVFVGSKSLPIMVLLLVGEALYKPVTEKLYGQTLGKRVTGIRVVTQEYGGEITWNQSLLRFLPWALSFYATIFVYIRYFEAPGFAEITDWYGMVDFQRNHPMSNSTLVAMLTAMPMFSTIWIFSDVLRRAIHDRIAGTVVISDPRE